MIKLLKYSKMYHWLIILCLTLPFFNTGCESQQVEDSSISATDTSAVVAKASKIDTVSQENLSTDSVQTSIPLSSDSTKTEQEEKLISQRLAKKIPLLRPILIPKEDSLSGLAMLIDSFFYLKYFGIFLFWLFLSLSLTFKHFDKNSFKTFFVFDIFALLFLIIAEPVAFEFHRLWGFWITLILVVILTIFDLFIIYTDSKKNKGRA